MKRILAIFLLTMLICPSVLADGSTYHFEQFDMDVTTPEGFIVITRNTPDDDPVFEKLGLKYTVFLANMIESRIILNAIRTEPYAEISVSGWKDDDTQSIESYNGLSESELEARAAKNVDAGYTDATSGMGITGYSLYQSGKQSYIMYSMEGKAGDIVLSGRQYQTVQNGMCIVFSMIARTETFSAADADILRDMVDGCEFAPGARSRRITALGNIGLVIGMLTIGAVTMLSANKRSRQLKAQIEQKKIDWAKRASVRPSYCPVCGAKMDNAAYCTSCGTRHGFYSGKPKP